MAFESLDARLAEMEPGIRMIETAYQNGLKLVIEGGKVDIAPASNDIDMEQAALVAKILQRNSAAISHIAGDQEKTRALLAETQKTLAEVYWWWSQALDLWDRMEKSYRKIFTDDQRCVAGETCIEDAVVSCTTCGERRAAQWLEENSTMAISQK